MNYLLIIAHQSLIFFWLLVATHLVDHDIMTHEQHFVKWKNKKEKPLVHNV